MKNILIAGGSGMIGTRLQKHLRDKGYNVGILSRNKDHQKNDENYFYWDVDKKIIEAEALQWSDALINLSGAGIADKRWTEERKNEITQSRVKSNAFLLEAYTNQGKFPEVYLSSGGANYYGDGGDELKFEHQPKGSEGFLPESCEKWEIAVNKWREKGIRTVQFRMAMVLSTTGGALPKLTMTLPLRIVPVFGNGQQWMSWIHIDDLCNMMIWSLEKHHVQGIYNAATPHPERNKDFAGTILEAYDVKGFRPSVPETILNLMLGEMSETVLTSIKISVDKIRETGFEWQYPNLVPALKHLFKHKI